MNKNPKNNSLKLKPFRKILRKKATYSEKVLWQDLRGKKMLGFKFYRQFSIGPFICDFYCHQRKLAIELDGISHRSVKVQNKDRRKTAYLKKVGVRVLRFGDEYLFVNYERVLEEIREALGTPPAPS